MQVLVIRQKVLNAQSYIHGVLPRGCMGSRVKLSQGAYDVIIVKQEKQCSHTPLGAAAASAASLTFIKLPYITIARYIITITSTYTQSKTVLFPYSLLINMKGLGGWDTVKLR